MEHDDALADLGRRLTAASGASVVAGNDITVLRNGIEIFPAMIAAIRAAERSVDLVTYVYWKGPIAVQMADALARASGRGARVRVVLDSVGSVLMDERLVQLMSDAGVDVELFRSPSDRPTRLHHRTHRKLLVCDESVAFIGGVGIAEEWEGDARTPEEWRDTHFRITGPIVANLRAGFIEHWVEAGHAPYEDCDHFPELEPTGSTSIIPVRGSSGPFWHESGMVMDVMLRQATQRLWLTTAYFAPGERIVRLLMEAAQRDVDVRLLLPGTHLDWRVVHLASSDLYAEMIDAGVRVFHYEQTMLHAKILTIDGRAAMIGSANVDERSLRHNEEMSAVVLDPDVTAILDRHAEEDLALSVEIDADRWRDRSLLKRIAEKVVDPFEQWL